MLGGDDEWSFYHPHSPHSIISFTANNEIIQYSDYDFAVAPGIYFRKGFSSYNFNMPNFIFTMITEDGTFPPKEGMQMNIPFLRYYYKNQNHGNDMEENNQLNNGSTIQLTVTKIDDKHFDAIFSGKLWSVINPDTLFITHGEMENMPVPFLFPY